MPGAEAWTWRHACGCPQLPRNLASGHGTPAVPTGHTHVPRVVHAPLTSPVSSCASVFPPCMFRCKRVSQGRAVWEVRGRVGLSGVSYSYLTTVGVCLSWHSCAVTDFM